jgi:hypothetical protein
MQIVIIPFVLKQFVYIIVLCIARLLNYLCCGEVCKLCLNYIQELSSFTIYETQFSINRKAGKVCPCGSLHANNVLRLQRTKVAVEPVIPIHYPLMKNLTAPWTIKG